MIVENEIVVTGPSQQGSLEEEITMNAPQDLAYQHLRDVQQWPRLLPHVEAIDVIYDDGLYQEFYMTVRGEDGGQHRVRSVRKCDQDKISFFQVDPPKFLDSHAGGWRFRHNQAGQCVVNTYHRWKVNDQVGVIYSPANGLSPQDQVEKLLRDHARFALTCWKQILEGNETTIQEKIVVSAPVRQVYETFAGFEHWCAAIPDVLDAKLLYDDGAHQEFLMTVSRPNGPETVRGFRYLEPDKEIELFQPQPPPSFKRMRGIWSFKPIDAKTEVSAARTFVLQAGHPSAPAEVAGKLREHLKVNLGLFKQYIERVRQ